MNAVSISVRAKIFAFLLQLAASSQKAFADTETVARSEFQDNNFVVLFCACDGLDWPVGVIIPRGNSSYAQTIAYETNAAALELGRKAVNKQHLLDGFTFKFTFMSGNCSDIVAGGVAAELIIKYNVAAIIGPACIEEIRSVAPLSTYYNVPTFAWGLATSSLSEEERYSSVMTVRSTGQDFAAALMNIINHFKWDQFATIYYGDQCADFHEELVMIDAVSDTFISRSIALRSQTAERLTAALTRVSEVARIVVLCLTDPDAVRRAMLAAFDNRMLNEEYVYIIVDSQSGGYVKSTSSADVVPIWQDTSTTPDGRDDHARLAFAKTFLERATPAAIKVNVTQMTLRIYRKISTHIHKNGKWAKFKKSVAEMMKQPPFSCEEDCSDPAYSIGSDLSIQLHDVILIYTLALNRTLTEDPSQVRNGTRIVQNCAGTYTGISNNVTINSNGRPVPTLLLENIDINGVARTIMSIVINDYTTNSTMFITSSNVIWSNYKGKQPLSIPVCGFKGEKCTISPIEGLTLMLSLILVAILICVALAFIAFLWRRNVKTRLENELKWQIPCTMLQKFDANAKSSISLMSTATKKTHFSNTSYRLPDGFQLYTYNGETVFAREHKHHHLLSSAMRSHFRKMWEIDSDNMNKFLGLSMDGPECLSLWKFCMRGSLKDIICSKSTTMDGFFVQCLINDVVQGLHFIHNSFLEKHGSLTSSCCFVDSRWQVKISDYGMAVLGYQEKNMDDMSHKLYTAPELLRIPLPGGTKEGDIYSFAIICAELIRGSSAWSLENSKEDAADPGKAIVYALDILYLLKKGGRRIVRPALNPDPHLDIKPDLVHLVRDCWEEYPGHRPKIQEVRRTMKTIFGERNANLMDHVFKLMEQYANSLEEEVQARTKELVDEKKKSDNLLCRMLPRKHLVIEAPTHNTNVSTNMTECSISIEFKVDLQGTETSSKQIAEKLRQGHAVIPEAFDSVSIFFSDIVSFTELSAKCTPMQVVDLLNDFYTTFDSTIEKRDVYKVETIGDAYLCVSGLPHRNGNEHIKEICLMSISLLKDLKQFRISHMPSYRIMIRIGIHTGPCVAGVVGLAMPKYCLFGDTVNTASRMESNGKPGKVHMSEQSATLLKDEFPELRTDPRGEILIKGKGVMNTFWLINDEDTDSQMSQLV